MAAEEVCTVKEKLSTVHCNNMKEVLRASQELAGPLAFQAPTCKV